MGSPKLLTPEKGLHTRPPRLSSQILMPPSRNGLGLRWRWELWLPGPGSRQQQVTAALMQLQAMVAENPRHARTLSVPLRRTCLPPQGLPGSG